MIIHPFAPYFLAFVVVAIFRVYYLNYIIIND
jgi:hypothetical protein